MVQTLKRYARLYRVLISQFFKVILQSKVDFMMGLLGFFFTQIMGIAFLYLVFQQIPSLQGWTLDQLIFIYGFAQIPRGIDHLLTDNIWLIAWRMVINGDFDRYMLRPMNIFFQIVSEKITAGCDWGAFGGNHPCGAQLVQGHRRCGCHADLYVCSVCSGRSTDLYIHQAVFCITCLLGKNEWTIPSGGI